MMTIYMVFAGDMYYPGGGMRDYRGRFDHEEAAERHAVGLRLDWWQIVRVDEHGKVQMIRDWYFGLYGE
jgi:hypothetical protein